MKQEMMTSYGGTTDADFGYDVDPKYRKIFDVISVSHRFYYLCIIYCIYGMIS